MCDRTVIQRRLGLKQDGSVRDGTKHCCLDHPSYYWKHTSSPLQVPKQPSRVIQYGTLNGGGFRRSA